jgi:hypothetical protein
VRMTRDVVLTRCCSSTFQSPCMGEISRHYPGRWIDLSLSPDAAVSWPPRSPDFNSMDLCLWSSNKSAGDAQTRVVPQVRY